MIDERTILYMMVVVPGLLALVTLGLRYGLTPTIRGMGGFALALGLIALASILPLAGPFTEADWRPIVSNIGYTPATSLIGYSICRFFARPLRPWRWVIATLAVYLAAALLSLRAEDSVWRIGLLSLHLIASAGLALHALLRSARKRWTLGGLVLGFALLLLILAPLYRMGPGLLNDGPLTFLAGDNPVVAIYLVLLNLGLLFGTLGLILLCNERIQRRLHHLATHDSLTSLLTRRGFHQLAQPVLGRAEREGEPVALNIVDIDHFKRVNDKHGHQAGDQVLREVAKTLSQHLRGQDLIGRFGGEEFAVLLPDTSAQAACDTAERLRRAIESLETRTHSDAVQVTVSIGVAVCLRVQPDRVIDELYRSADRALYRAKAEGRNQVRLAGD